MFVSKVALLGRVWTKLTVFAVWHPKSEVPVALCRTPRGLDPEIVSNCQRGGREGSH